MECEQTEYITQSSQAVWPSEQYFNQAMVEYGFRDGTGQPQVDDNLLMVQVYFTSLNVQRVQESPTYQASRDRRQRRKKVEKRNIISFTEKTSSLRTAP